MESTRIAEMARRLKAARALSGKEVGELAPEVGIEKRSYYRLERGDRPVFALELWDIARATGQPIEFFFAEAASLSPVGDGRGTVRPGTRRVKEATA